MARLKVQAKKNLDTGFAVLRRWWSRKYKLPPTHELFEKQTIAELNLEMLEDLLAQRQDILDELDDEDTRSKEVEGLFKRLNALNRALGYEEEHQDDLVDEWERELEAGETPDLNKG